MIRNTNLSSNESYNWKLDWAQWLGKGQKCPPQIHTSVQYQATKVYSASQYKNQKIDGNSVTKNRTMRNRHLAKFHKVTNVKRIGDQYDSILSNNRFNVFNSAELFPESALACISDETNVEYLHVDDKCQLKENLHKKLKKKPTDSRPFSKIVPRSSNCIETKGNAITKACGENIRGESLTTCTNLNVSDLRRCRLDGETEVDKCDLDLRFRPRHQNKIADAKNCNTFRNWNNQNCEKFGFIPLGDSLEG